MKFLTLSLSLSRIGIVAAAVSLLTIQPAPAAVTLDATGGLGERNIIDSAGVPLPDGNEVRFGFFNSGFDVAANQFNPLALEANFNESGATTIITLVGQPGRFVASHSILDPSFDNQQIYMWIFKTNDNGSANKITFANVEEYAIFTSGAANWFYPEEAVTIPPSTLISTNDVDEVFGNGAVGPFNLQIPEPSHGLLAALGLALLSFARKKREK